MEGNSVNDRIHATTPYLINIIFARFDRNIPLKSSGSPDKAALQVTHTCVLKALKQLNTCKDTGPDGVGPKGLHKTAGRGV